MDVFNKYMFAQTLNSISSEIVCKYFMQLFKRHYFLTVLEFLPEHEMLKPLQKIEEVVR